MRNDFLNKNSKSFIVLVPAYNEVETIGQIIAEIKKYSDKIIVVNDGSLDDTGEKAQKAGAIVLKHSKNLGKGAALKTGFEYILKNFPEVQTVIIMDADGQHDPSEIKNFLATRHIQKADLIIGERQFHNSQNRKILILRKIWNKLISFLISVVSGSRIKDSQSGFRLINAVLISKILPELKTNDYRIESEFIFRSAQREAVIIEIPIKNTFNKKANLKSFFRDIWRLFKILSFVIKENITKLINQPKVSPVQVTLIAATTIFFVYLMWGNWLTMKASTNNEFSYVQEMQETLFWLKNNSSPDDIVLSEWTTGHQIVALADRRVVATTKVYPSEAQEVAARYKDLARFFFAPSEDEAGKILEKYNISWIFVKKKFDNFICRYINACTRPSSLISKMLRGDDLRLINKAYESQNFLIYKATNGRTISEPVHFYSGVYDADLIKKGFQSVGSPTSEVKQVSGLILPHHYPYVNYLLADLFNSIAPPETAVLIGPDHQNITSSSITTALGVWETPFGPLSSDEKIIESLTSINVPLDNNAHLEEWSLRTIFPYLKYAFPKIKIVPILIKNSALSDDIKNLAQFLSAEMPVKTLYILSTDFVHKLTTEEAQIHDAKSIAVIQSLGELEISNLNLDSTSGLKLFLEIMNEIGTKSVKLVEHSNDYEITKEHPEFKPYSYLVTYMTWKFMK